MDLEPMFFRLHVRLMGGYTRMLSHKWRRIVEYVVLFQGFGLLFLLIILHLRFVVEPGCSVVLKDHNQTNVEVYQIQIQGVWKRVKEAIRRDLELVHQFQDSLLHPNFDQSSFLKLYGSDPTYQHAECIDENDPQKKVHDCAQKTAHIQHGDNNQKKLQDLYKILEEETSGEWLSDPVYLYAKEKGFLEIPHHVRQYHRIGTMNITLPSHHDCLGEPLLQSIIENFVGYGL
eukprot:TRINITY_DN4542_c0_g1_i2.p2 TRINITY_DN4542_c0_g1~~TRINITY_DN4542_c0_g1_i2.p2  ORF type:complete len:231 (-),score=47.85 TRINITY_DN4542_c0_g1_i2:1062-1754(-)